MARTSAKKFNSNTSSGLFINIQDGPNAAGAMFIHKDDECIMVLFDEEFAALRAALDVAERTKRNWNAKREAS